MNKVRLLLKSSTIAVAVTLLFCGDISWAADENVEWITTSRPRWEVAIGAHSWSGLADLNSAREGSFDEIGFNLGFAVHWPVKRFASSELLAGVDLGFFSNESDIRFISDDLTARNGYVTPSVKWMFGSNHRYSIDAGLGYYLQDVVEVAGDYYTGYWETQLWEDGSVGGYIGGTIDFGGGRPTKNHGVMLSFKTHLVEFGRVSDESGLPPTLGPDAGDLSGPVYMLQVGYRWR